MDPTCVFNFFTFFERIFHKSNCIIFTFSWCATHTKIRSKLVVIVTAGSQKITLWGPQRTPLGILRVNTPNIQLGHKVLLPRIPVTELHQSPTRRRSSFDTFTFGINAPQQTDGVWKANRLPIGYSCPVKSLLSWRKELSITCSEVTITLSVAKLLTELHDTHSR